MPLDLRSTIARLRGSGSRWRGFEQLTGWSILSLSFPDGDVLGLRVFPYSDFAPYASIWHRDPHGAWSVYVDGPALEVGCPRWWGPALQSAHLASIAVEWVAPDAFRVTMAEPALDWSVRVSEGRAERLMNLASSPMPAVTWRPRLLRAPREWLARWVLRMGRVRIDGLAPAGMGIVMMPERIYGVTHSRASLSGVNLGEAARAPMEPLVGDFPFPVRGVLAIGDFRAKIQDEVMFQELQSRYNPAPPRT